MMASIVAHVFFQLPIRLSNIFSQERFRIHRPNVVLIFQNFALALENVFLFSVEEMGGARALALQFPRFVNKNIRRLTTTASLSQKRTNGYVYPSNLLFRAEISGRNNFVLAYGGGNHVIVHLQKSEFFA